MKTLIAMLAVVLAYQAQAQVNRGSNLQQIPVEAAEEADVQARPQQGDTVIAPGQSSGNPIYILNSQRVQGYQGQGTTQGLSHNTNQTQGQAAIQEQPVTVVQESPLKRSGAELTRKRRQDVEAQTEDGIVQALEKARMEDEVRRREKFNSAIAPINSAEQVQGTQVIGDNNTVQQTNVVQQPQQIQQVVPAPVQVPVQVVKPAPKIVVAEEVVVAQPEPVVERAVERAEVRAAIEEAKIIPDLFPRYAVSGIASFGNYNAPFNVSNGLGYGVALGMAAGDHWLAEGTFIYSNYRIEELFVGNMNMDPFGAFAPMIIDMRQYNLQAAMKYQMAWGKFRPVAGGILSYTRRAYNLPGAETFRTTDAIDAGAMVGADWNLSWGFAVGLDFRYLTNLGFRSTNQMEPFVYQSRQNVPEKIDYYTINLLGKFTF